MTASSSEKGMGQKNRAEDAPNGAQAATGSGGRTEPAGSGPGSETVARRAAGAAAAALVEPGMLVGLGTGDTAAHFIRALAARQLAGLRCIATSRRSAGLARELGFALLELDEVAPSGGPPPIDLTVDGADEIDPQLRLIKGAGGALLFEKLVAHASRRLVIIADGAKRVQRLGEKRLLPIEIVAFGARHTLDRVRRCSAVQSAELRLADGAPYHTDSGNLIVDARLQAGAGADLNAVQAELKAMLGVIETGLFLTEAERALLGAPDGSVEVLERS
ncbi:MAG: ribose-5-phosphate isomerase RpiA [Polyangia bacterium]